MIADPSKLKMFDGFLSLIGGVDAGRNPSLIGPEQCAGTDNMVFRGGVPTARPGFGATYQNQTNEQMTYTLDGAYLTANGGAYQSALNLSYGVFQGAAYYAPGGDKPNCFMAMISGRLYEIIPRPNTGAAGIRGNLEIREIELERRNASTLPRAYFCQADRFMVIQDGQSKAIVFDGVTATRSETIPVGTIMEYGMGRLVVVTNDFRCLEFGDLYGSHDEADPGLAVLKFTESTFLNEGGSVSLNFAMGKIKGLIFPSQQDSSTGDGELLAWAEGGVTHFHVSLPREEWKNSVFAQVTLQGVTCRGDRALVSINGDVWFRADDGWRSYRQARAEITGWAHLPMSTEVRDYTENDTVELLDNGSAIWFHNRLLGTCTPIPNSGRPYHNGMLSLDFDVLSSFGETAKPAWDGHESKMRVTQLVSGKFNGVTRAYAFVLATGDLQVNQMQEITVDLDRDYDGEIAWELVTRSYDFKAPFNEKELFGGDLWVKDVPTTTTISVWYRPDQHPTWTFWQTLPPIAAVGTAQAITPGGVPTLRKGFFPRRTLCKPPTDVDGSHTNRNMRRGFEFQVKFTGTGHCAIGKFRLVAQHLVEDDKGKA